MAREVEKLYIANSLCDLLNKSTIIKTNVNIYKNKEGCDLVKMATKLYDNAIALINKDVRDEEMIYMYLHRATELWCIICFQMSECALSKLYSKQQIEHCFILKEDYFSKMESRYTELENEMKNQVVSQISKYHKQGKLCNPTLIESYVTENSVRVCKTCLGGISSYPLHFFAVKGDVAAVNELLKRNMPPNMINNQRESALYLAAQHGHYDICCLLLRFGAQYNSTCILSDKTPEMVARQSNHVCIVALFQNIRDFFYLASLKKKKVVNELKKKFTKDVEEYLTFANANNVAGETLLAVAVRHNCGKNALGMIKLRLQVDL